MPDHLTSARMEVPTLEAQNPLPNYWELISDDDKCAYIYLRKALAAPTCKNRRNRSIETFSEIIDQIKSFVVRNDGDDWKRSLVCGICWLKGSSIAINTRQLRLIVAKCKSSINGSFQLLGYGSVPTGAESSSSLIKYFPFLKDNFAVLRQWTVRQKIVPNKCIEPMQISAPASTFISPVPEIMATKLDVYTQQRSTIDPIYDNNYSVPDINMGISIFDDPMSFVPSTQELRAWDATGCKFDQESSDFRGIDLCGFM